MIVTWTVMGTIPQFETPYALQSANSGKKLSANEDRLRVNTAKAIHALQILPPLKCDRANSIGAQARRSIFCSHDCMIGTQAKPNQLLGTLVLCLRSIQSRTVFETMFECSLTTAMSGCPVPRLRRDNVLFHRPQALHTALTPRITSAQVYWMI